VGFLEECYVVFIILILTGKLHHKAMISNSSASELHKLLDCHELQLQTHPRITAIPALPEKFGGSNCGNHIVVVTTHVSCCTAGE